MTEHAAQDESQGPSESEVVECPNCGYLIHPYMHVCRGWRST